MYVDGSIDVEGNIDVDGSIENMTRLLPVSNKLEQARVPFAEDDLPTIGLETSAEAADTSSPTVGKSSSAKETRACSTNKLSHWVMTRPVVAVLLLEPIT